MADVVREDVQVYVNGRRLPAFKSISVTRSLSAVSGAFQLEATEVFDLTDERPEPGPVANSIAWPIPPTSRIDIRLGPETILRGFVDVVRVKIDAGEKTITAAGRDAIADLVDSNPIDAPQEWLGADLLKIAGDIADTFGVNTHFGFDRLDAEILKPFPTFAIQPGETAYEAIERACRMRGLLAIGSPTGVLLLSRPGDERFPEALRYGSNLTKVSANFDFSNRFRRYVVRGQGPSSDSFDTQAFSADGEAIDSAIRDTRSLVVISEGVADVATTTVRAQWESTFRAAKGGDVTGQVQGWRETPGGEVWKPGKKGLVDIAPARVRGLMLLDKVNFVQNEGEGSVTNLTLVRPDAYIPKPEQSAELDPAVGLIGGEA